jgi:hypothetical protein
MRNSVKQVVDARFYTATVWYLFGIAIGAKPETVKAKAIASGHQPTGDTFLYKPQFLGPSFIGIEVNNPLTTKGIKHLNGTFTCYPQAGEKEASIALFKELKGEKYLIESVNGYVSILKS